MNLLRIAVLALIGAHFGSSALAQTRSNVRLAESRGEFVALWQTETRGLTAQHLASTGEALEAAVLIADDVYGHEVSGGDDGYVVAWTNKIGDLFVRRLTVDGQPRDSAPTRLGERTARMPSITWTGTRWFVVWYQQTNGLSGLFGAFIDRDGATTAPVAFVSPQKDFSALLPQVAWNGAGFLVTWSGFVFSDPVGYSGINGLAMVRLNEIGMRIDPDETVALWKFGIATHQLASDGRDFFITYDALDGGVRLIRVSTGGGSISVSSVVPLFEWFNVSQSALAWDGSAFVLLTLFSDEGDVGTGIGRRHQWLSSTTVSSDGRIRSRRVRKLAEIEHTEPRVAAATSGGTLASTSVRNDAVFHNATSFHVSASAPTPPTILTATLNSGGTNVEWTGSTGEVDGFTIHRRTSYNSQIYSLLLKIADGADRAAVLKNYSPRAMSGQVDGLTMRAFNEGGASAVSNLIPVTIPRRRTVAVR